MTSRRVKIAAFRLLPVSWEVLEQYGQILRPPEGPPLQGDAAASHMAEADALLITPLDRITGEMLAKAPNLKFISSIGAGLDHVDLAACESRGIQVANAPWATVEPTADLSFGLMLAAARRLVAADAFVRDGSWTPGGPVLWGLDVHHRTLGIIGMGRIGKAIARRAQGFSMRVIYHDRHPVEGGPGEPGQADWRGLDDLLAEADFVIIQAPLTPETRNLIGARELGLMKPTAVLVNSGRGGIVDEAALAEALDAGVIAAAALDVFDEEPTRNERLLRAQNLLVAPHIGTATRASRREMLDAALENLARFSSEAR